MRYCEHCGSAVEDQAAVCPHCGKAPGPGEAAGKKGGLGVPILAAIIGCGCLGAVAMAGIIAAILIPNFLDALQKGRQKRTIGDLRELGIALGAYGTDSENFTYPDVDSFGELQSILVPEYLPAVPVTDGWGHPLRYECWQEDPASEGCDTFRLASPGADGEFEHEALTEYQPQSFEPTDYDRDIVFAMAGFVRAPRGSPGAPLPAAGEDD